MSRREEEMQNKSRQDVELSQENKTRDLSEKGRTEDKQRKEDETRQ